MPRRTRTAKKLAQRIDLGYFKRRRRFQRWLWGLSLAVAGAALLWLAGAGVAGNQRLYSSGRMSSAHAVLAGQCSVCHVAQAGVFGRAVSDAACLACHDGPLHNDRQVFTPSCADCHVEHEGARRLAATSDRACTQCHARLRTKSGSPEIETAVYGFGKRHPEFTPLRPGEKDPGTIKLNHEVHLKAGLKGPAGNVHMECGDCHRPPAVSEPWPYAEPARPAAAPVAKADPLAPAPNRAYMAPITYARQCAACHPLLFDERFAEPVPHDKPEVVHAFVVKRFRDYIARHPADLRRVSAPQRRLPGEPPPAASGPLTPDRWVALRVAEAERLLWHKTCKECHTLIYPPGALPEVAKPAMTVRWLRRARFNHEPHRMLACAACHSKAPTSQETQDVLLPGIDTCRQCHRSGDAAEARCFECHRYHDWSQQKRVKGRFTLPELLRGAAPPLPPAAEQAAPAQ